MRAPFWIGSVLAAPVVLYALRPHDDLAIALVIAIPIALLAGLLVQTAVWTITALRRGTLTWWQLPLVLVEIPAILGLAAWARGLSFPSGTEAFLSGAFIGFFVGFMVAVVAMVFLQHRAQKKILQAITKKPPSPAGGTQDQGTKPVDEQNA